MTAASPPSDDSSTSTTVAGSVEEELLDYVECLRGQGLDIADPQVDAEGNLVLGPQARGSASDDGSTGDAQGPTQAERERFSDHLQAGQEVCGELPEGVVVGGGAAADNQDALLAFAQRLRDNGLDVADPDPSSNNPAEAFGDVMDSDDPQVQSAVEECQQVFTDSQDDDGNDG